MKPSETMFPPADQAPDLTLKGRPLGDFNLPAKDDPNVLIGNRWLSRGDIFILASTSGMGKSSLSIQAAVTWGLGLKLFDGFLPHRPLKSLIVQSEDGDGDIAEVRLSIEHAMNLTTEQKAQVNENVIIVTDRIHRGLSFRAELKRLIAIHKPDLVWINPLLAFLGGDVNDSTDVGNFLREQLNSLNEPPQFAYGIVHHTAKPPKEKAQRQWNEVMYEMAGSADLTNAARAILALQATEKQGEFKLICAKRGPRAGLTEKIPGVINPEIKFDQPTSVINLRHSNDRMKIGDIELPVIFWERFGPQPKEQKETTTMGRPRAATVDEMLPAFPIGKNKALGFRAVKKYADEIREMGNSAFQNLIDLMLDMGVIVKDLTDPRRPVYYRPDNQADLDVK